MNPTAPATRRLIAASLLIAAITFALDQWSKWWLLEVVNIDGRPPIEVTGFFKLVMVWNRGISFGLFNNPDNPSVWPFVALSMGILLFLLNWLRQSERRLTAYAIGMVVGGAIGNVTDRLHLGAVADFFYFHIGDLGWPAFNVADAAICIGVALLCIDSMLYAKSSTKDEPSP